MYKNVIVLDTETGGWLGRKKTPEGAPSKNVPEIIEIGAIALDVYSGMDTHVFQSLIKNTVPVPQWSRNVHGIGINEIDAAPASEEVMRNFQEFVDRNEPVEIWCHNSEFDMSAVERAMECTGNDLSGYSVRCTLKEARKAGLPLKLGDLYQALFNKSMTVAHRALPDALYTANCVREMHRLGLVA